MKTYVNLSDHFTLEEATISQEASRRGFNNIPTDATVAVMVASAAKLETVRALLTGSIHINSWYRSLTLNRAIGSKDNSQHIVGEAIDFICPDFGSPTDICKYLSHMKDTVNFDQLILEHTWVHISFAILSGKPRKQVLSLIQGGHYATGLTDILGNAIK